MFNITKNIEIIQRIINIYMVKVVESFEEFSEIIKKNLKSLDEKPSNIKYWGCFKKIKEIDISNIEIPPSLTLKIALLSSFTIEPLAVYLDIECRKIGLFPEIHIGGFNQFRQEIFDINSQIYRSDTDIIILAVKLEGFLGEFKSGFYNSPIEEKKEKINQVISEIKNLTDNLKRNSSGLVLINNFIEPTYNPYGIIDNKEELGIREFYKRINLDLINSYKQDEKIYIFDLNKVASDYGIKNTVNPKMKYMASMELSEDFLPYLVKEYLSYVKALIGRTKKCIVLDLDNTLWGGIIGEDGFNGIKLNNTHPGNQFVDFQKALLELHQRGILLAINSKNNFEDAIEVIRSHPFMVLKEEFFTNMKINWNDKATNMIEIAREIGIDLDTIVFIDDNPAERELIKQALPEVLVIDLPPSPSLYVQALEQLNDFNLLSITPEDKERGEMYHSRKKRKELEKSIGDLDTFLDTLDIKIKVKRLDDFSLPRVSNLIMKTNQFNLTTKRYTKTEIQKISEDPNNFIYVLSVKDKFGDEGIVGVAIIKKNEQSGIIDLLLMSCRVLGRKIENAFLYKITQDIKENGIKKLKGLYIKTKKNVLVSGLYKDLGFILENESEEDSVWILNLERSEIEKPNFIKIGK